VQVELTQSKCWRLALDVSATPQLFVNGKRLRLALSALKECSPSFGPPLSEKHP